MSAPAPVRAFIQARMSSSRFPGKVLAPLAGRPVLRWVVEAVGEVVDSDNLVVATSTDPADDPLVAYLESIGVSSFRGPRAADPARFRLCAESYPSEWILRICGDSPLLDPAEVRSVLEAVVDGVDLVTTKLASGSPHGRNAELIRTETVRALDRLELPADDRAHVTPFLYRNPGRFAILEVDLGPGRFPGEPLTVDSVDDLTRLERLL
jgi:spore coat polysaccharide biosynthesis protein SpsF